MAMLGPNKWIEFSWDGIIPRKKKEDFKITFHKKCNKILPFDEACDNVAVDLGEKFDNLYLGLSGGADSEYIANCLVRNNVKFTPIIMQFDKYGSTETWYALRWCERNNIVPYILKLNYHEILTEYKGILAKIHPRLSVGASHMLIMQAVEKLGGNFILGSQVEFHPDESFIGTKSGIPENYKGFIINESDAYMEILSPGRHPGAFFYWNPDIIASTISNWDTSMQMPEAKAKLYKTLLRPKFVDWGFVVQNSKIDWTMTSDIFGNIDCALLGNKEESLKLLVA